jgi:predicted HAD superfamily hydrolase
MNNNTIQIKIKERLNKLDSLDYDNIECWQIVEAFNKTQIEWCRRQLHGGNIYKEGDEMSKRRVDDLQILLRELALTGTITDTYFEATNFPTNYLEFKRVSTKAKQECCPDLTPVSCYLAEEANVNLILRDPLKRPDFQWRETFCTMIDNKIRIYRTDFDVVEPVLTYYKKPRNIEILNCVDPYTGIISNVGVISEFKDDIVELIIDEAASMLAGDINEVNQALRGKEDAERSN